MLTDKASSNALGGGGISAVIPERVFGCVPMQMFTGDVMMDAKDGSLEKTKKAFGCIDMGFCVANHAHVLAGRMSDSQVLLHLGSEPVVTCEFIGAENRITIKPAKHQRIESKCTGGRGNSGTSGAAAFDRSKKHWL